MALTADIMFVNDTALIIMLKINLNFVTVKNILSQIEDQLSKSLNKTIQLCGWGGFGIHVILMEMEFKKVVVRLGKF